ncbi:unnamed protein product [Adineta ricciae]|uniref:Uncharacterized protein n=1 Tax=Adineta ricciae TaxID=249248 RepID=A0A816F0W4_ADIRI|nr:unnamed protein product [Adineta ricciae]
MDGKFSIAWHATRVDRNGSTGLARTYSHVRVTMKGWVKCTIYIRKPLHTLVEINTSEVESNLDGLRPKLIPIPLIKKRFTVPIKQLFGHLFDRVQSGRKIPQVIQVTRTQLPSVPAFAITTYKAQGLTMNKILVDLQVPPGALQVASIYVPLSRVKKEDDIVILRPFDMKVLQVQPSSVQDAELKRLDDLDKKDKTRVCLFHFFEHV